MSTYSSDRTSRPTDDELAYPTSDGRPMGETDLHREVMFSVIESLKMHYAGQRTYVSGNILLFYRPGDRRRHISPDVLVVKDLEHRPRENYLLWKEGRPPNVVIEVTSRTTRREDLKKKFELYRDEIRVAEYFLFDPLGDYLQPRLQGFRLREGQYEPIDPVDGRLPSLELGLSFECYGDQLRIFDPQRGRWLPTHLEVFVEAQATTSQMEKPCCIAWRRNDSKRRRNDGTRRRSDDTRRRNARRPKTLDDAPKPKPRAYVPSWPRFGSEWGRRRVRDGRGTSRGGMPGLLRIGEAWLTTRPTIGGRFGETSRRRAA